VYQSERKNQFTQIVSLFLHTLTETSNPPSRVRRRHVPPCLSTFTVISGELSQSLTKADGFAASFPIFVLLT
jgi:hypothetical protein